MKSTTSTPSLKIAKNVNAKRPKETFLSFSIMSEASFSKLAATFLFLPIHIIIVESKKAAINIVVPSNNAACFPSKPPYKI